MICSYILKTLEVIREKRPFLTGCLSLRLENRRYGLYFGGVTAGMETFVCVAFKDRQHRRRGGSDFPIITHEPNGVEYRVIDQMNGNIYLYIMVLSN